VSTDDISGSKIAEENHTLRLPIIALLRHKLTLLDDISFVAYSARKKSTISELLFDHVQQNGFNFEHSNIYDRIFTRSMT
jgi:hypothetical protein